jgi:methylglyoxal reductase
MDTNVNRTVSPIPNICLGLWEIGGYPFFSNTDNIYAERVIEAAIENDIKFFDTAPIYGLGKAEIILGRVINKTNRNKIIITTKGGLKWNGIIDNKPQTYTDNGKESLRMDIIGSLERLGTDYIDIFQLHWPEEIHKTSVEEIVVTLEEFKKEGLIHHYGVSNHNNIEINEYLKYGRLETSQNQIDFLQTNILKGIIKICKRNNIKLMGYGLLQNGLLTNKDIRQISCSKDSVVKFMYKAKNQRQLRFAKEMRKLSFDIGISLPQLIISYALNCKLIDVAVIGTKNIEHVKTMSKLTTIKGKDIFNRISCIIEKII